LDMAGSMGIFGPPHLISQKLFRAARELGFFARIAGSRNLHTAACLTRAPGNAIITVPPGEERTYLHTLPLTALDLTEELLDTLNAWGLRSVGELAALLPADLVARLGQEGHRLHRLACGHEDHLLVPAEPAFTLEEHLAFDAPVDNLESLLFVLGPMLDQLILRARTRALLLASVTVRLHLERSADQTDRDRNDGPLSPKPILSPGAAAEGERPALMDGLEDPTHTRALKPALPLDDRNLLLKLIQLDLQAHPAPAAFTAITLHAEPGPRPGVQSGLFSPQSPEPMRLEVTLARIAALVGQDRVGQAILTDAHRPESFGMQRFTITELPNTKSRHRRAVTPKPETSPVRTGIALRRLRPAPRVDVTHADGRPYKLRLYTSTLPTPLTVHRAFGPWRRSGQWWSGAVWSHEEWDIDAQAPDGTHLLALLTNDRLHLQWQLVALYD
ncbi:MAG TPA: hypothetical protein VKV02_10695, partial [Acidobacteriaceae bacterium]|nr:hypothetical protein [Acidobacteriaceae bacterium]